MVLRLTDTRNGFSGELEVDGSSRYIWEEGNFSCDCNRALMLYFDTIAARTARFLGSDRELDVLDNMSEMECNSGDNLIKVEIVSGSWN